MNSPPTVEPRRASLTAQAGTLLVAKTIGFALGFVLPLLLVRRLSQHDYGVYKQIFLLTGTALSVLPLGFGMSAYYYLTREADRRRQVVANIVFVYAAVACLAAIALVVQPHLLARMFNNPQLTEYAPLIGAVIVLWVASAPAEMIALGNQQVRVAAAFILGSQITRALALVGAAIWFGTIPAILWAVIIQGLVNLAMMLWYLKARFYGFWRAFEWTMLREQLAYALPFGVAGMMFSVQMDLHSYFVASRFSAEMYAIYAVGCFQLPLVGLVNDSVASVVIPQVSDLERRGRHREILLLMTRVIRKLAAVTLPLYAFLVVVAPDFITFLFTERYRASWPIFAINLTMLPLTSVMVDPVFRAFAGSRFYLVKLRIGLILAMAVMLWFATRSAMGLVGIIAIVVAVNATGRLMAIVVAGRLLDVTRRDLWLLRDVGKLAMAAATAAVATAAVRMSMPPARPVVVLLVCGLMFASVYLTATIGLRIVTSDERDVIRAHMTQMLRWTRTYGQ